MKKEDEIKKFLAIQGIICNREIHFPKIDITKLTLSDVGREVIYSNGKDIEHGYLKSWNDTYVFVRFYMYSDNAKACYPQHLSFC